MWDTTESEPIDSPAMTDQQTALTKIDHQHLTPPAHGSVSLDVSHRPAIIQQDIARAAQYHTAKSRGLPVAPVSLPKLPGILPLTLAAIIALSFLVAASMFSIGLTAYSNSVDRVDRDRTFMRIE